MSNTRPIVLLTRPSAGSSQFAEALKARFGERVEIVTSPLQEIEWLDNGGEFPEVYGLIFTSQNGVLGWNRDKKGPHPTAYCVGPQTTALAESLGLNAVDCGGNANALVDYIVGLAPLTPLVHIRGEHGRGNIAEQLNQAGIETFERIIYRQTALSADVSFKRAFQSGRIVIAPLFSPRSVGLFMNVLPSEAEPWLAIISANAAERVDAKFQRKMMVASAPNREAMLDSIEEILFRLSAS